MVKEIVTVWAPMLPATPVTMNTSWSPVLVLAVPDVEAGMTVEPGVAGVLGLPAVPAGVEGVMRALVESDLFLNARVLLLKLSIFLLSLASHPCADAA